jgi:dTDP-6-deoxy-L-talose 4-dehydrogenase (NAD+)
MILLTGATGFIGKHVLRAIIAENLSVRVVLRSSSNVDFVDNAKVELTLTDNLFIETQHWWEHQLEGVDTVLHLAWYAEPGLYLHSAINFECLSGTLALGRACEVVGVRRFVGVGTCFEYDVSARYLSKDTPLKPETLYAAAKASAFNMLLNAFNISGVEFTWCRMFYLYGEGEDPRRLVPYIIDKISHGEVAELTSGKQVRDYLDVRVAAKRLVEIAYSDVTGAVNVCSGKPITVKDLAFEVAARYGDTRLLNFGVREDNSMDPPFIVGVLD